MMCQLLQNETWPKASDATSEYKSLAPESDMQGHHI